ncbi:flagellar motor switch protein FliN [Desulfatirhabdium butyrativorans]|uniref:flagellar motor switch protein FliN n=1 Tax=Desulfatirhabdium butyrativorans TaxID=340467 RepID=UPI000400569D|nr:flagellar motor switch protein FliN [Desulfatirhabdium butyrativorans]
METIQTIDIATPITKTVLEVFDMMLGLKIEPAEASFESELTEKRIVGSVNMAGVVSGVVSIHVNYDFAVFMASSMLGSTPEETGESEVKDVMSELVNIVGGNVKSFLNDSGLTCVLSTPSITYGTDFIIETLNVEKYEKCLFAKDAHPLMVEAGLRFHGDQGSDAAAIAAARPPIDIERINALDISVMLSDFVPTVFETMLSLKVSQAGAVYQSELEGLKIVGGVSFAGDVMGVVTIHVDFVFAQKMAKSMMGMADEETASESDVRDVIGELGNIIGGKLKSYFTDAGLICELSTPSITRGKDFHVETLNLHRYERLAFQHQDSYFFLEAGVKFAENLNIRAKQEKEIAYEVIPDIPEQPREPTPTTAETADAPTDRKGEQAPPEPAGHTEQQPTRLGDIFFDGKTSLAEKFPDLERTLQMPTELNIDLLMDVPLEVSVEIGRKRIQIRDLLKLREKSLVELNALAEDPVNILVNNRLIAKGVVMVEGGKYGIKVIEILSRMDRIRSLQLD